jgi:protein SCO1/2
MRFCSRHSQRESRQDAFLCYSTRSAQILSRVALALALFMGASPTRATASPVTVGGPFTLMASDGTTVTDRTYAGKWLLVYFGYTFCPSTCPTALLEIATALKNLGPDAARLQPIFITIDPTRDTAAVMGIYTRSFDPRIAGLTGTAQQIAAVAKEYGAYYARNTTGPGADDYVMDHSTYLYLMNPQGKFVRGFDTNTSGDHIAEAMRKLMARSSDGASRAGLVSPTTNNASQQGP